MTINQQLKYVFAGENGTSAAGRYDPATAEWEVPDALTVGGWLLALDGEITFLESLAATQWESDWSFGSCY